MMFKLSEKSNDKTRLIGGLKYQVTLLNDNAELLAKLYPDLGYDLELRVASKVTQTLIDKALNNV